MMVRGVEERTARRRRGFSVKRIDAERLSAPRWRNDSHATAPAPRWTGALDRSIPPPCVGDPSPTGKDVEESLERRSVPRSWIGVRSRDRRMSECRRRLPLIGSDLGGVEDQRKWRRRITMLLRDGKEQVARFQCSRIMNPERSTLKETSSTSDHRLRCAREPMETTVTTARIARPRGRQ
jgi:hypothetical protein